MTLSRAWTGFEHASWRANYESYCTPYENCGSAKNKIDPMRIVGEWRDVFPTFEAELTVRFRATDFPGETVLHCHFLRHEDLGMMDTVLVTACAGDSCNACWSNSELCNEDGRVDSLLTLPTVKSS